jgi:hypothetical protein
MRGSELELMAFSSGFEASFHLSFRLVPEDIPVPKLGDLLFRKAQFSLNQVNPGFDK